MAIARNLAAQALWWQDRATWIGDLPTRSRGRHVLGSGTIGWNLYGGTAGVGWFLALAYAHYPDPLLAQAAAGAIRQAIGGTRRSANAANSLYTGRIGVAIAAVECADAIDDPQLADEALELLTAVPAAPEGNDIISGCAGAAIGYLRLGTRLRSRDMTERARECGDLLLQRACRGYDGWSWTANDRPDEVPYSGLAHGQAGIAWALGELSGVFGDSQYASAALDALRYERRFYDPEQKNWRGQNSSAPGDFATVWCHGAGGIAMTRFRLWHILHEPRLYSEARQALQTVLKAIERPSGDFSLCHGRTGQLELLLQASDDIPHLSDDVARHLGIAVSRYMGNEDSWPCGLAHGGNTPGLLLGLAGIGQLLLRAQHPRTTPSALLPTPDAIAPHDEHVHVNQQLTQPRRCAS